MQQLDNFIYIGHHIDRQAWLERRQLVMTIDMLIDSVERISASKDGNLTMPVLSFFWLSAQIYAEQSPRAALAR